MLIYALDDHDVAEKLLSDDVRWNSSIYCYQSYVAEKSSMYLATRLTCIETTSGLMTKNGLHARYSQKSKKKLYVRACVRACVRAWSSNLPLNLIFDSHIYLLLNTIIY